MKDNHLWVGFWQEVPRSTQAPHFDTFYTYANVIRETEHIVGD